ncbi:sugar transporter ERD6-like 7 isoform X2 [Beta vulgaris subsp. vulgaris]|uniref:sugar transporter ERD6-like 7 isoform X2 n=1 Tax=Beta vulgaris subsp. vulgaris TaxID=3555 RepID=UPI0020369B95|nr:sugar transporter ERD6-like 7 isoform X2 [Beta vulgaris subsp. vulgaris]
MAFGDDEERGEGIIQQDIQQPLIQAKRTTTDGGRNQNQNGENGSRRHPWMVYLSTFVAVCGSYEFGACAGYSSPTQSAITAELGLSTAQYALFGSILTVGAMIGAITSGPIADFIGRKGGSLALDIGRLAGGYGMGAFSYVVPVYIAEIAPVHLRGALTTLNQVMICAGVSVAFIIGIVLPWRALALTGLIPCVILLLGLFFIPESPRWLAKKGARKEFEAALQKLRGSDADINHEAAEIQNYIEELEQLPKASMFDLFQTRYLRSVTIAVGLMVFQQFGGINGICFYVSNIFEMAGFSPSVGTVIYALLQVVITTMGATLIDKAGRKPLLLVSAVGLVIGCILTAIAFYFKAHELSEKAAPILAITGILVYISAFSVGMGAVPWVVMSEIFPINVKGVAGSLATLVNWFGAWAISYTFNFLMEWSSSGTFIIYAVINAAAIIFVVMVVPETKGRSLEQIQADINA